MTDRERAEYNRRQIVEAIARDLNVTREEAERIESARFQRALRNLFSERG